MRHPFPADAVPLLLDWYRSHARDLPWRADIDPYRVLVSEIMLQQTRAETVKPYFTRFIEALPTVSALAEAEEDTLLKLWEGLGYYSRVRNLQRAARRVMSDYGGVIPADVEALLSLPGVGRYTAGAVASIAYGIPAPAVDGNVLRVVARLTADDTDVLLPAAKTAAEAAITPYIPTPGAGDFTQSLIELGALVCLPGEPHCADCPLSLLCRAKAEGRTSELPVRGKPKQRRVEERVVFLLRVGKGADAPLILRKRPRGLLGGLYEFPNLLLSELPDGGDLTARAESALRERGLDPAEVQSVGCARHLFSHVEWRMEGVSAILRPDADLPQGWLTVSPADMQGSHAVPSAFAAFREAVGLPPIRNKKPKK